MPSRWFIFYFLLAQRSNNNRSHGRNFWGLKWVGVTESCFVSGPKFWSLSTNSSCRKAVKVLGFVEIRARLLMMCLWDTIFPFFSCLIISFLLCFHFSSFHSFGSFIRVRLYLQLCSCYSCCMGYKIRDPPIANVHRCRHLLLRYFRQKLPQMRNIDGTRTDPNGGGSEKY